MSRVSGARAEDKLKATLRDKIHAALVDSVGKRFTGSTRAEVSEIVAAALSDVQRAPAISLGRNENGPVLMLDLRVFVGRTAGEMRAAGLAVGKSIPDCAVIRIQEGGGTAYEWIKVDAAINASRS